MVEKIECHNCGKEVNEDAIECYNCNNNFCDECTQECEECNENFCDDCFTDSSHECDVGFELIVGFKNTNGKFTFDFSNKQKAKDIFQKFALAVKGKDLFIEHENTLIDVSEIKYIDLRL